MKLRVAKKVLKAPDRYTGQQRYDAAHRLYRQATTQKNGWTGFAALTLKPQRSFHEDDTLDLRLEYFQSLFDRGDEVNFPPGEVVVPTLNADKPIYRRDGQVANMAAIPYPGRYHYKAKVVELNGEVTVHNELVVDEAAKRTWEMGEWRTPRKYSAKKYQVRTGGKDRGTPPPRIKFNGKRTPRA